jgi:hypothetical protein
VIAIILCAILGAPITLVLHEFAHCVAAWATGGRVTLFRPWPHRYGGKWYLGRVQRVGGDDQQIAIAPLIKANVLIWCYALAAAAWWPVVGLLAWEIVDAAWWYRGWVLRRGDGGQARNG